MLAGAKFCPECGAVSENARLDTQHTAISHAGPRPAAGRHRLLIAGGIGALVAAALIAGLAIVLLRPPAGPSYLTRARAVLLPVVHDNRQLAGALSGLTPGSDPGPAKTSAQITLGAARAAQQTLGALSPGNADRPFAARARAALTAEVAWLQAAASVLANPGSPRLATLSSLGVNAQATLRAIDAQVPGASSSFPASAGLITYARARAANATTKRALTEFSRRVEALLNRSAPAFEEINNLFAQMQTVAAGGTPTITLGQAEASLASVIANRTALAAAARALHAPTLLAATVRADLEAAMQASLANDQAISTCLYQANNGTVAFIFQSCLNVTGDSSGTATNAKQQFLTSYNKLRRQIGKPPFSGQF